MKTSFTTASRDQTGFTLVELCVVIVISCLLGSLLLPAVARTRPNTRVSQCLDNARQMAVAVQMYTTDNHDLYPPNPDDGNAPAGDVWCAGYVQGGLPGFAPAPQTFNPDILTNASVSLLAPYLNGNAAGFSCPADPRIGTYQGTNTNLIGTTVHAARSISMNQGVGTADPGWLGAGYGGGTHSGKPVAAVPGRWLTGSLGGNTHDNPWATFGKTADFRVVKPSQIFLMTDEDPYSINDATLAVSAGTPKLIDYPATWHDYGSSFSFCDGHAEVHRWEGTAMILNGPAPLKSVASSGPDYADWTWLWQHATVRMH